MQISGCVSRRINASTTGEIEAAFATLVRDRADALFVNADVFFGTQAMQIARPAAQYGIPAAYDNRAYPEVGGLMSYGPDVSETCRQVGVYTGQILKGEKPANMPVQQVTKIELVINLKTAKTLGMDVPLGLSAAADELIE
jgi:putative tryptophan/tyrosine transport system substrate-binding protein